MTKLWILLKLNFRALLNTLRLGGGKKGKVGGIGALLFLAGISLYISGVYSFMFGSILSQNGLIEYLIPLIGIIGCFLAVVMTLFAASGFVFGGKDSDLVLSLPVSAFSVMLSKILALYLECLVFCALFLGTAGAAYIYYGGEFSVGFVIRLILGAIFLPVLAALVCTVLAYILAWVSARSTKKNLVSTIISFGFFVLVFVLSLRVNSIGAILLEGKDKFEALLGSWLLPFGLLKDGIISSWLSMACFCLISLVPFLLVVWLMSARYKKILSGLASRSTRSDYKLKDVKFNSQLSALFKKELRRYFGSSIYLMNTSVGMLILVGGAIYGCFAKGSAMVFIAQLGGISAVLPMLMLFMGFTLSLTDTTCVSISLEGKTLWILKESPVPAEMIFRAKVMVNLLITWPSILISLIPLSIVYGVPFLHGTSIILACMVFSLCVALFGLIANLRYPKMDADNDTVVVKQSASSMIGYFAGLVPVAALAGIYLLTKSVLGFPAFCLLAAALLAALCAWMWHALKTWGAQKIVTL